jgi:hypothetical protein
VRTSAIAVSEGAAASRGNGTWSRRIDVHDVHGLFTLPIAWCGHRARSVSARPSSTAPSVEDALAECPEPSSAGAFLRPSRARQTYRAISQNPLYGTNPERLSGAAQEKVEQHGENQGA